MREVLLVEAPDGFIVQGLVLSTAGSGGWADSMGQQSKETLTFLDDDIARFMDEAVARRGGVPTPAPDAGGYYERAFRVLGRYMDEQKPRDVFFFEQDGAFVVRLLMATQTGRRHVLAEFTRDDIEAMVAGRPHASQHRSHAGRSGAGADLITKHDDHRCVAVGTHDQQARPGRAIGGRRMNALKTVAVALGITLAALIIIPLVVLAGLFVWLKLTEESDEEALELDQEGT
jgi:hypothetical protein